MTTTIVLGCLLALCIAVLGTVGIKLAVAAGARAKQDAALIKAMGDQLCAYNDTQVDRIKAEQIGPYARASAEAIRTAPRAQHNGTAPDGPEFTVPDRSIPTMP